MPSNKRTFQIAVVLVLSVAAVANAGYLRSHAGVGSDCANDAIIPSLWTGSPATARRTSGEPAKGSKFVTPEITEEKYYNRDTGLFMIHKLTSQEAQSITAKIEPGIKEPKAQSQKTERRKASEGWERHRHGRNTSGRWFWRGEMSSSSTTSKC